MSINIKVCKLCIICKLKKFLCKLCLMINKNILQKNTTQTILNPLYCSIGTIHHVYFWVYR